MNPTDLQSHSILIAQSKLPMIVLPANASFDQQLAAASLNLALTQAQKKPSLCAVKKIANPTIPGLDLLNTKLGSGHLLVSFEYEPQAVDKVSYHLDEEQKKFYLTIKPQKGEKPLNKDLVEFEYVGADADLIILFGVAQLENLEQLYLGYEDLYQSANIISVVEGAPSYQCNHIDSSTVSSACEVVYQLLTQANVELDSDVATNLLAGIQYQTNNFTNYMADANTFEAVASLLRLGARRKAGGFEKVAEKIGEKEVVVGEKEGNQKQLGATMLGGDNVNQAGVSTQLFGGEDQVDVGARTTSTGGQVDLNDNKQQSTTKQKTDQTDLLRPSGLRR